MVGVEVACRHMQSNALNLVALSLTQTMSMLDVRTHCPPCSLGLHALLVQERHGSLCLANSQQTQRVVGRKAHRVPHKGTGRHQSSSCDELPHKSFRRLARAELAITAAQQSPVNRNRNFQSTRSLLRCHVGEVTSAAKCDSAALWAVLVQ